MTTLTATETDPADPISSTQGVGELGTIALLKALPKPTAEVLVNSDSHRALDDSAPAP